MSSVSFAEYRVHLKGTLRLAWPIFIGQIGQVLMGVIDTAMVGQVGKAEVAAAGVANAVFILFAVFGFGLSSAVSPLVSMAVARNDKAETAGVLRGAYYSGILLAIPIQVVLWMISFRFDLLGQDTVVASLSETYLRILSFSVLPMLVFLCAKQFVDGLSRTRPAMFITLAAVGLNTFFNWVLIYGNLGFPASGLDGAGYATLLTRLCMMSAMLVYIGRNRKVHDFVIQKPKGVKEFTWKVLRLGVPSGFQYFFEIAAFGSAMIMAGWIGVDEQAAHQIAINTAALTYMGVTGLSAAGSILVGAAYGSGNTRELRIAGKSAILLGIGWMLLCGIIMALFRFQIAGLYIDNAAVLKITASLLVIAALFQVSDGIQAIGLGILRGIADVRRPTLITLFAYWVIGLPVAYLLGFHTELGIEGIWYGLLIGLTVSAVLLYWRFNKLSRQKPSML